MSCVGAFSHATGQISAPFHRHHQPRTSSQMNEWTEILVFPDKPQHTVRFQLIFWWPTAFHLFPPQNSALLCDVHGPEANVSPACNYPQCPYAVWEEWKGLTSFWPSAALRFLSHPSLSPASPISNSSLRGLSVLVSLCVFVSSMCVRVTCPCVSVATFTSSNIFVYRIVPASLVTKHWRVSPFDCKSLHRLYKVT